MPRGGARSRRATARRHARCRAPHRPDHAGAVFLHRAGSRAAEENRDRAPQRLRGAQRRRARRAHAGEPRAARAGQAAGGPHRVTKPIIALLLLIASLASARTSSGADAPARPLVVTGASTIYPLMI